MPVMVEDVIGRQEAVKMVECRERTPNCQETHTLARIFRTCFVAGALTQSVPLPFLNISDLLEGGVTYQYSFLQHQHYALLIVRRQQQQQQQQYNSKDPPIIYNLHH